MGKTCSFCEAEITRKSRANEHVIPEWLLDLLEIERKEKHNAYRRTLEGEVITKKSFGARNIVYGSVCEACNSGWLSDLEGHTKPIFERLFKFEPFGLTENEANTLARWAYKTSLLLALTADEARKKLIRTHALSDFRQCDDLPSGVNVSLILAIPEPKLKASTIIHQPAFIQTEQHYLSQSEFEEEALKTIGFLVILQLGHVLLRVTVIEDREKWQMLDENRAPFQQIQAQRIDRIDWPPKLWPDKSIEQLAQGVVFRLRPPKIPYNL